MAAGPDTQTQPGRASLRFTAQSFLLMVDAHLQGACGQPSPAEDVLGVTGPQFVLRGVAAAIRARPGGVTGHHVEAGLGQPVEGLLQEVVLQVVPGGVPVRGAVRVPALVQGFSKDLFSQTDLAADGYSGHPAELGIRLDVSADGVGASVPDGDVARTGPRRRQSPVRGGGRGGRAAELSLVLLAAVLRAFSPGRLQAPRQLRKLEIVRFFPQPPPLFEELREEELRVPQVVQDVAEQRPVPVEEEAALVVFGQLVGGALAELGPQQRVGSRFQGLQPGHIHLPPHVELDYVWESGPAAALSHLGSSSPADSVALTAACGISCCRQPEKVCLSASVGGEGLSQ